jgi:hypothetical protein
LEEGRIGRLLGNGWVSFLMMNHTIMSDVLAQYAGLVGFGTVGGDWEYGWMNGVLVFDFTSLY